MGGLKKLSFHDAITYVHSFGFKLLNKNLEKGSREILILQCKNDHITDKRFNNFKKSPICKECFRLNLFNDFHSVKSIFEKNSCTLLSENYEGQNAPLKFRCKCGEIDYKNFVTFKKFPFCKLCGNKNKRTKSIKYTESDVIGRLEELDCLYISGFDGSVKTKIKYICPNGHTSKASFDSINNRGHGRCKQCATEATSGENNYNWKGGIRKNDEVMRVSFEYKKWRTTVFIRDNRTCRCCGVINKNIVAHHLDSWNLADDKRFDVDNGITLCEDCHKLFHMIYKYGNNTKEQFEEFLLEQLSIEFH
jgi:hypothetical protein